MCLAIPAKVVSLGYPGTVDIEGNLMECRLDLVPEARVDDYVLMHAGIAIGVISPEEAEETLALLEEAYGDPADETPGRDA